MVKAGQDAHGGTLLRRGFILEYVTLGWNIVGIAVLAVTAITARSVALAGFGLDSFIEIGASTVVIWELSGSGRDRQRRALRLIGTAFALLALYLAVQSSAVLVAGYRPGHSPGGIAWTAVTAAVMFALAAGKARAREVLEIFRPTRPACRSCRCWPAAASPWRSARSPARWTSGSPRCPRT